MFTIAIDGPAGSGKSTTARAVAQALGFSHLDTGAMYRAVTHLALKNKCSLADSVALTALAESASIVFVFGSAAEATQVSLNGEDVTKVIRSAEVAESVSQVATHASVRSALVEKQREFAREHENVVAEGRDIGTVVFPEADLKVYLDASPEERARRRELEITGSGAETTTAEQLAAMQKRDEIDSTRKASPLMQADGAVRIDTTGMSIAEQVDAVVRLARERMQ